MGGFDLSEGRSLASVAATYLHINTFVSCMHSRVLNDTALSRMCMKPPLFAFSFADNFIRSSPSEVCEKDKQLKLE